MQEQPELWTDDLVCTLSGVGSSTNQIYRENGLRREGHECEDRSFHYRSALLIADNATAKVVKTLVSKPVTVCWEPVTITVTVVTS